MDYPSYPIQPNSLTVGIPDAFNVYAGPNPYIQQVDAGPQPLQLHAPVPLPSQAPILYPDFQPVEAQCPQPQEQPVLYSPEAQLNDTSRAICEPQGSIINPDFCSVDMAQPTFPTPSELLAELAAKGLPPINDEFGSDARSETARKARRRAMAKSVGFVPTDPDTISSHEKKRHYLECLEHYILYLHQQFELLGVTPPALERVPSYRGLSSQSIRTLLVHMEHNTRRLNGRTLEEEQRFIGLRNQVFSREGGNQAGDGFESRMNDLSI
ncbi:unnamed protein product [Cyclocybe aegerita]|uniref:Uncharacterized protein n=1 Tax=Cyclocybe aegerita TaxID=1973307 RepID=A0A8S0X448_CYCAE|nr:unnamed protein product [Cyclocybe aegerita]